MKRPTQCGHDSTDWRRHAYGLQFISLKISACWSRPAKRCIRIADRLEAMEPREWQPAGTMPVRELVRRVK